MENEEFLTQQLITYLGNKRSLLNFIGDGINLVKSKMKKEKLNCFDVFSGSGIVSRYLKQHSNKLIVNDIELYSNVINNCYLVSAADLIKKEYKDFIKSDDNAKIIERGAQSSPADVHKCFDRLAEIVKSVVPDKEPRSFPDEIKQELYIENNTCFLCKNTIQSISLAVVDHIKPYSDGGRTIKENGRIAHIFCNQSRGNR